MARPDPSITPKAVRSPWNAKQTEIDWADGHVGVYPHDVLRGYCPCAGCQGHSGAIRFIPGGDTVVREITTVGDYALALKWGDGHDTGIYSFRYLRSLCQCPRCVPPEQQGSRPERPRL
jgi:DUF971 family protein